MVTDVACWLGEFAIRTLRDAATPTWLLMQMDRCGIDRAWVGYLPNVLNRDPSRENSALAKLVRPHRNKLVAVPTVNPAQARWEDDLSWASERGAPAVRVYPQYQGLDPAGSAMRVFVSAAAMIKMPVILTVRLEDARQRHPTDTAGDFPAAAVRRLVRGERDLRLLVTHASRDTVEEVHFGLTPEEAARVLWDVSWIWGPPEDHLAQLLLTVGSERFTFGTGMPLRIPDAAVAKVELLDLDRETRTGLMGGNLEAWLGS